MKSSSSVVRLIVLGTLLVGATAHVLADEPDKKEATSPTHLGELAFMSSGVWRGTLPPGKDGSTTGIELRAEWTGNHQGIRFESNWVRGGKIIPYTSGLYFWDGAKQQIGIIYTDAQGSLTQGGVSRDAAAFVHDFTMTTPEGRVSTARSRLTPEGNDAFLNEIFLPKDGGWEKFVEVRYRRTSVPSTK